MDEATSGLRKVRRGLLPRLYFSIKFILFPYIPMARNTACKNRIFWRDNDYSINSIKDYKKK